MGSGSGSVPDLLSSSHCAVRKGSSLEAKVVLNSVHITHGDGSVTRYEVVTQCGRSRSSLAANSKKKMPVVGGCAHKAAAGVVSMVLG